MALINIPAFSGLNILAAPQRIEDHQATVAVGCDFRSLDLRAFRSDRLTDLGAPAFAGAINAGGASIYQLDDDYWIGALGDKNFARSPTFFSDATTGQRLFVCDNAAPTGNEWDWVQEVRVPSDLAPTGNTDSWFISSTSRRLGVPKPANFADGTISHTDRNGAVTYLIRATNADSEIHVGNPDALNTGDKIILNVPGIGDGPFAITEKQTGDTTSFKLRSTKLVYAGALVTAGTDRVANFNRKNHGLYGGEQVIINIIAATSQGFKDKLTGTGYNGKLFNVNYSSVDDFTLSYADTDETFKLNAETTGGGDNMRFAVVSAVGDQIDDAGSVVITLGANSIYQQRLAYTPSADVISTWTGSSDTLTERAYVVTFVNKYGDESEPSAPSKAILVDQGDPVTFASLPTTAATYAGDFVTGGPIDINQYSISQVQSGTAFYGAKIRLYRTDANGTFRLVTTEVDTDRTITWDKANTPFIDTYPDTELGEPLATAGWQIPPKDLNGILISPGGSLVGYKDRSVLGSVPYAPYAFPISNRVAFDYPVVGLVGTSAGIVVVTKGMPALIVGDDPAAWSIQKLEYPYGCVSRRSIVDMGELAIYASADGLIGIAGANVEILTRDTIKREQWQDLYNPKNIIAAHAEGRYYGITTLDNGTRKAFMFDPRTRSFIDLTVGDPWPVAMYSRLDTDTLLILKSDGQVYEWNRGSDWVDYTWQSKWFQLTRPDIFGCGQILSPALIANYKMTMTLYGWDGESVVEICKYTTVNPDPTATPPRYPFDKNVNPFRLPVPNDRYTVYTVKLEGSLPIGQVSFASTIDELKQV